MGFKSKRRLTIPGGDIIKSFLLFLLPVCALWAAIIGMMTGSFISAKEENQPDDLVIQRWSGIYPVSQLNRLPACQRSSPLGYIYDAETFAAVWEAFRPGEKMPEVDFNLQLVLFYRNVTFFNRTNIAKVTLKDGVAEVICIETLSALPIEDNVAMAMALIPLAGVRFIQSGQEKIAVTETKSAADPLNATYAIDQMEIRLQDGSQEVEAAPGAASKFKTSVLGPPVYGNLDDDDDDDAVLILVHESGGSGTFYYVAAARSENGLYCGTNSVLLGDRVTSPSITLRNGVIIVNFADRKPEEPMTAPPTVEKSKYLILKGSGLEEIKLYDEREKVLEGWVTIGDGEHSFSPCAQETDLWILEGSPALQEIISAYHQLLPGAKPCTPLFMILAGTINQPPKEGFSARYERAFRATQLVRISPQGNCKSQHIVVKAPAPGAIVTSPLRIHGRARGMWFFEGDFPVLLKDPKGNIIALGFASAKGEWMTEKFVPFEGVLEFKTPIDADRGTLILKKDNPSDLPEHDDALEIPIFFK